MEKDKEYLVTQCLPDENQEVLCFGHYTDCCKEDMDKEPSWHRVIFKFEISEYKLKEKLPIDPEESLLEYYRVVENWEKCPSGTSEDGHVIGVTKWKSVK